MTKYAIRIIDIGMIMNVTELNKYKRKIQV